MELGGVVEGFGAIETLLVVAQKVRSYMRMDTRTRKRRRERKNSQVQFHAAAELETIYMGA